MAFLDLLKEIGFPFDDVYTLATPSSLVVSNSIVQ